MSLHLQSGMWLPGGARPTNAAHYRCTIPVGDGNVCGHPFLKGEEKKMEAHVRKCARDHIAQIHEEREKQHPEILKPWDPELHEWIERNGALILEGRKTI